MGKFETGCEREMTASYTFDENLLSDIHKDARGFRPGQDFFARWKRANDDVKQQIWDMLVREVDESIEAEKAQTDAAVFSFEAQIDSLIQTGAGDRKTAIRWMVDSIGLSDAQDPGYICYMLSLPYSMETEFKGL